MMPFEGGVDSMSNGTLILSALAAILYLFARGRPAGWRRTVIKTAAVALLAVLAAIEGGPWLLIAGLALSAAGDAFLAHDGEKAFLGGLASFLAAHVAYVALFVMAGGGIEIVAVQPWRLVLPAIVLAGTGLLLVRLLPAVPAGMRTPVTVYIAAILAIMVAAATVPAPIVMIGAALFVASDAVLAVEKFLLAEGSRHHAWTGPAVWVLYYAAQAIIALAFIL